MDRDQIVKMVDEVVEELIEELMEGGPGSGRYPEGSGKHPDSDGGKGGEHPKEYERKDPTWDDKHREHMKINSRHADIISKKAERGYTTHGDARDSHRVAANIAEKYGATKLVSYHREKEKYHKTKQDREKNGVSPVTGKPYSEYKSGTYGTGIQQTRESNMLKDLARKTKEDIKANRRQK